MSMAAPKRKRLNVEGLSDLVRLHLDRLTAEAARLDGISVVNAGRALGLGRLSAGERGMLADVLQARLWTPERRRRSVRRTTVWRPGEPNDDVALLARFAGIRTPGEVHGPYFTMGASQRRSRGDEFSGAVDSCGFPLCRSVEP